jgi:hypothetical protein
LIFIVQLSVLFAAGSLLFIMAWHRPEWVILAAVSICAVMDLLQIAFYGLPLGILGVNLLIDTAMWMVLLGTSFVLLLQYRKSFPRDALPFFALMILFALSFSRGVSTFGKGAAEGGVNNLLTFVMPALAIMLVRPAFRLDAVRLAHWLTSAGLCLAAVALLRWADLLPTPVELHDNLREVFHTLTADYSIIVGQAFIAAIYLHLVGRRSAWYLAGAGILGVITFLLQQRGVWVATAAGLAWLALRTFRISTVRWLRLGAITGAALSLIMVMAPIALFESTSKIATINVHEAQKVDSTWAWRVEGYEEAIAQLLASGPLDILIGPPAGWAEGTHANVAVIYIHDRYIDTLANYGIVGFTVLLLWFGILTKRVCWPTTSPRGTPARDQAGAIFLEALLLSEMVYLIPWFGGPLQGAILGLIWVAAKQDDISIGTCRVNIASHEFDLKNKPAIVYN